MADGNWTEFNNAIGQMRQEMQTMLSEMRKESRDANERIFRQFERSDERIMRLEATQATFNKDHFVARSEFNKNDFVTKDDFNELDKRVEKVKDRSDLTWLGMWATIGLIASYVGFGLLRLLSATGGAVK